MGDDLILKPFVSTHRLHFLLRIRIFVYISEISFIKLSVICKVFFKKINVPISAFIQWLLCIFWFKGRGGLLERVCLKTTVILKETVR